MKKLVMATFAATLLLGSFASPALAESELEKGVRHDNREVDKGVEHDAKEAEKGLKHDDEERHKADKHVDKEVKKDL
ncbi:hypothetical protein K5D34_03610 [Pseudomonas cichorii]|uniref:Secreted protein n=2 Tax=Pseudomonas syringae group TaxID=136849 RepID=A0A3M4W4M0_PSECI|nr:MULTISPECIES: hypothetical protein [Pseudomonas]AHF66262.1 hypothetical protein PCH70_11090 [Pseudomonas cichorii JBC1]MBX8490333.1 hypothetical protein [Pseudomonas cichorii]MBX8498826.1 hypothetical protein [Pseudomonas lijiangensis]MBX8504305.1 hypothetical protein [Pseudomonas lijiangensis]MBX8508778.1 hypothetical protein [Pseudomonas cichorii]